MVECRRVYSTSDMAGNEERLEDVELATENSENVNPDQQDTDKSERLVRLPLSRIKHIIKMDPDVSLASQDAVIMIAKAAELFLQEFAKKAFQHTTDGKRKTVQRKDLEQAIEKIDELAFLEGTL